MTTDAKFGLLLALVFIVAITFVINGLPDFLSKTQKAPDTTSYIKHYRQQSPAVVGTSRNIAPALSHRPVIKAEVQPPVVKTEQQTERYRTILPTATAVVKQETIATQEKQLEPVRIEIAPKPATKQQTATVYTVQPGDSLAKIAQKAYGFETGNRLSTVEKLYKANKNVLTAMDQIQVGQKLIIPSIGGQENSLLKTGLFEKVDNTTTKISPTAIEIGNFKTYTVQEDDSLWKIAADQLGNGSRYNEIIKLNKTKLANPDRLVVGTKLKLPAN